MDPFAHKTGLSEDIDHFATLFQMIDEGTSSKDVKCYLLQIWAKYNSEVENLKAHNRFLKEALLEHVSTYNSISLREALIGYYQDVAVPVYTTDSQISLFHQRPASLKRSTPNNSGHQADGNDVVGDSSSPSKRHRVTPPTRGTRKTPVREVTPQRPKLREQLRTVTDHQLAEIRARETASTPIDRLLFHGRPHTMMSKPSKQISNYPTGRSNVVTDGRDDVQRAALALMQLQDGKGIAENAASKLAAGCCQETGVEYVAR